MKKIIPLIMLCLTLTACSESSKEKFKKKAATFEIMLEGSTGESHTIVKTFTNLPGYIVIQNDTTGEITAYNLDKFSEEGHTTLELYIENTTEGDIVADLYSYEAWVESGYWTDEYGNDWYWDYECDCLQFGYVYIGKVWVDTSSFETFYTDGLGYVFNNTRGKSKDLEALAGLSEEDTRTAVKSILKEQYSLSANRAVELANMVLKFRKLATTRELTLSEKNRFALDATGVSMSQIELALKDKNEGEQDKYKSLLNKAASVNGTTPEQIGQFFKDFVE